MGSEVDLRTGFGLDVHAIGGPGPVVLGGVEIAHSAGLVGHSDADCLFHAVGDALLGAAALGDLGEHFPDDAPELAGADSAVLLARIVSMLAGEGWEITHVDVTVVAQEPRVAPHRPSMRENLARVCGIGLDRASVKATTTERLGFLGRAEGIAAVAVATVARPQQPG